MRIALVVGINHYGYYAPLYGCVKDAQLVQAVLERHGDGTRNFDVLLLTSRGPADPIDRDTLRSSIRELFTENHEIALLYFAGHGHHEETGGYLVASDCRSGDTGVALADVMTWANRSPARNKIIVLDSCHSGVAGSSPSSPQISQLAEGLTILTASTAGQYASEKRSSGVFTSLFVDAMEGAAANLVGEITPSSVYAHIEQALGPWEQRPVFKTNVNSFVTLRSVPPPISLEELRRITELFPTADFEFPLNPSFEPESANPDPENVENFAVLQRYNRLNLLVPVGAPHMWHAAMGSKSCKLTVLGQYYWRLVDRNRI